MPPTKINWHTEAERDLWRAICAPNHWHTADSDEPVTHPRSLWWFVHLCWGAEWYFRKHPEHTRWLIERVHAPYMAWLQSNLLTWKQQRLRGSNSRYYIAVLLPRGFGKTITATKAAPLWTHLNEPDMSTLLCSSTSSLSADIQASIMSIMDGSDKDSWFTWLYGNWRSKKNWSKDHCVHRYRVSTNLSEGSFDISGVDIGMTGYHHSQHIWDDPIIRNKLREGGVYMVSVHDAVNASYNALQPNGLLMFVLTRYQDDDVVGRHMRDEGVATWDGMDCPNITMFDKVPMGKGAWHVYFLQAEDEVTGIATLPEVMDEAKIVEHKRRDPEDFASQMQNNPGSGEMTPLLEAQLKELFMDYEDFRNSVLCDSCSVHIDTAFKQISNIKKGDDSAIVVWHHDSQPNGFIYLDTDLICASNEWRAEQFNDKLIEVFLNLRRRQRFIKALTDEPEPGGKSGVYLGQLIAILRGAGVRVPKIHQLNRAGTKKRARIRTSIGYWAEGYVRILLHKDNQGQWIIPMVVKKLFNQILRVDASAHDDLADAAADVFANTDPPIWRRPTALIPFNEHGSIPRGPYEEDLKALSRPLSNFELKEMLEEQDRVLAEMGPGHGWEEEWLPEREKLWGPDDNER
jgi:hypothetical protein